MFGKITRMCYLFNSLVEQFRLILFIFTIVQQNSKNIVFPWFCSLLFLVSEQKQITTLPLLFCYFVEQFICYFVSCSTNTKSHFSYCVFCSTTYQIFVILLNSFCYLLNRKQDVCYFVEQLLLFVEQCLTKTRFCYLFINFW